MIIQRCKMTNCSFRWMYLYACWLKYEDHQFNVSFLTKETVFIYLQVHDIKNSFKPLSQRRPIYPAWHPWSQLPVVMLHTASLRQCPLQLFQQPCPYVPGEHSFLIFWKNKIPSSSLRWFYILLYSKVDEFFFYFKYNHYIKVLKLYKFWLSMHSKV